METLKEMWKWIRIIAVMVLLGFMVMGCNFATQACNGLGKDLVAISTLAEPAQEK